MDDSRITDTTQLREFLKGSQGFSLSLRGATIEEKYTFINQTVDRFHYHILPKRDKRIVLSYLKKVTGYKKAQLARLIKRATIGTLTRTSYHRTHPVRIYTPVDVKLLEKTDELHLRLSERATKEILRREYAVYGKKSYQIIAHVSHAHITNLRQSPIYKNSWVNHTKARIVPIAITMKPENFGRPGSIRVDTVHQNDVFHINSVDEITQWEIVVCVPQICEACMIPALEDMMSQYPFVIFNFHSDRGGETINYNVADLLNRLIVKQTKSRSNHCNDNALAETKNGGVIRKNMGWEHINQQFATPINDYYKHFFNPYLNFHRPCGFPTITTDEKGKQHKVYTHYQTPYDALKGVSRAKKFLKPGITFDTLDTIAMQYSDNEWAAIVREEERTLFEKIRGWDKRDGSKRRT